MVLGEDDVTLDCRYPSADEIQTILNEVHAVHVLRMPVEEHSLDFLLAAAAGIESLVVTDWNCRDASAVSQFTNLRRLSLYKTDPRAEVDFSQLIRLTSYAAPADVKYASILGSRSLETIGFGKASDDYVRRLESAPTELALYSSPRVTGLPEGPNWANLEALDVHLARSFDLATLRRAPRLRKVELTTAKCLVNFSALADLPDLDELIVENCQQADEIESVLDLHATKVRFIGPRVPYAREFAQRHATDIPVSWQV